MSRVKTNFESRNLKFYVIISKDEANCFNYCYHLCSSCSNSWRNYFFVVKTANPKGKEGQCQWHFQNFQYQNLSCQAFVNKEGVITISLKNINPKEPLLTAASALKCANKNNYFMCVGLKKSCQILNPNRPNFSVKCPIPWGPMEAKVDFNIGFAKIRWKR